MNLLKEVVDILANGEQLPEKYLDHPLSGDIEVPENVILNLIGF